MLSRRSFVKIVLASYIYTSFSSISLAQEAEQIRSILAFNADPFTTELPILGAYSFYSMLDGNAINMLDAIETNTLPSLKNTLGNSITWLSNTPKGFSYASTFLLKRGGALRAQCVNRTKDVLMPYFTGLKYRANDKGVPEVPLRKDTSYPIQLSIKSPSATGIYHSLQKGTTGYYNHQGLAGIFCISDQIEEMLNSRLGLEMGITDIPLLLQDKRVNLEGTYEYSPVKNDFLGGFLGNTLLVNSTIYPKLSVSNKYYKFRIVNGSNARILNLGFRTLTKELPCHIINTGKGILEKPIEVSSFFIAPYERIEVLVDLRSLKINDAVYLINYPFSSMRQTTGYIQNAYTEIEEKGVYCLQCICTKEEKKSLPELPSKIADPLPQFTAPQKSRLFTLTNSTKGNTICWNINTPDISKENVLTLPNNTIEEWIFTNPKASIPQSIYIPYFSTRIISRKNSPAQMQKNVITSTGITATDSGNKDIFLLWPGETITLHVEIPKVVASEILCTIHSKILENFDKNMLLSVRVI